MAGGPFDIVFLDPPYDLEPLAAVVASDIAQRADGGVAGPGTRVTATVATDGGSGSTRTVRAGDSSLAFYL